MARKPLILVSPSIEQRGVEFHDLSASLSVKYDAAVLQAGGIPVTFHFTARGELDRSGGHLHPWYRRWIRHRWWR